MSEGRALVQTWATGEPTEVACPVCKTAYERRIHRFPQRDRDQFRCEVCGTRIEAWNDTACPEFKLATPLDEASLQNAYFAALDHARAAFERYKKSKGGPDEAASRLDLDAAHDALGQIGSKA